MNLLTETVEKIKEFNKKPEDVLWVGAEEFGHFTWSDFAELANQEYDEGYGGNEVPMDLVVVGDGWWLERHEYDGSEWWEIKSQPKKPEKYRKPTTLFYDTFRTLEEVEHYANL
jgi:hypothetical protein